MPEQPFLAADRFRVFRRHEFLLLWAILVVVILTTLLDSQHNYLNNAWTSIVDITRQTSMLGIFSLGAAIVIIAGGIDLSSGSVIAFSGSVCATLLLLLAPDEMIRAEPVGTGPIVLAILGTLAVGFLIGSLHAWLITVVGLPPFVATLATLVGLRSFGRIIVENVTETMMGGRSTQIQIFDANFRYLATSVWIPAVVFAGLAISTWLLLSRTVTGRHLYALGGNEQAARLSGIRTERLKWLAYSTSAVLSSIAGILYIGDASVADPQTLGRGYELNAIAAAVVGGCSLQGGVGTIPGTVLGALFLRTVIDGVSKVIKTGADVYEGFIVGCVVVFAVAFSQFKIGRQSVRFFSGALGTVTILNLLLLSAAIAALIGPMVLASLLSLLQLPAANLEGKHLAILAPSFLGGLLVLFRWKQGTQSRALLTLGFTALLVGGAAFYDRALPRLRYDAAVSAIESVGGTLHKTDEGTVADLGSLPLDDKALKQIVPHLRNLTDLVEIRLSQTQITYEGLSLLEPLKQLRRLDVSETAVTGGDIRRLKRALPDLDVRR
jgi:ribose/xylose/arabinose/galactoside ABC-type transport system permease subunit